RRPVGLGGRADGRLARNLPHPLRDQEGRLPQSDIPDPFQSLQTTEPKPAAQTSGLADRRAFRSKVDTIRPTYGFEDVSLAPGINTCEPADVDLTQTFAGIPLAIPVLAAAMDAVVDARLAGELARLGGLAVLNLEGVQARYDDPSAVLATI